MTIDEAVAETMKTVDKMGLAVPAENYAEYLDAVMDELRTYQDAARTDVERRKK